MYVRMCKCMYVLNVLAKRVRAKSEESNQQPTAERVVVIEISSERASNAQRTYSNNCPAHKIYAGVKKPPLFIIQLHMRQFFVIKEREAAVESVGCVNSCHSKQKVRYRREKRMCK